MNAKIFLKKGIPLTEELFDKISNFCKIKISDSEKRDIKSWNSKESGYAGIVINTASIRAKFFPSYGEESSVLNWSS